MIISSDLNQIETCVVAQLSGDETLIKLLNDDRDIHRFIVSNIYGDKEETIDKKDPRRTAAKAATYGLFFGNGPQRLSESTGQDIDWCKDFIQTFYNLFPRVKLWHQWLLETVERDGQLTLETGSILKFQKFPAKFPWQIRKGITESYNPPDVKNFPVQHTAFIIMALWVGRFFREKAIFKRDKYLMINEIHDSLMLDCRPEFVEEAKEDIQQIADKIPLYFKELWNIELRVPIKIETKSGRSWSEV